jgi:hypothetical protein
MDTPLDYFFGGIYPHSLEKVGKIIPLIFYFWYVANIFLQLPKLKQQWPFWLFLH